ncbi:hypothetical protein LJC46_01385 [Desulfovibrio sp. OttesenSCG-928-G15]|nr:hypothetical protein [Desulfovibrio sp. OttesenSCG-928-G15]
MNKRSNVTLFLIAAFYVLAIIGLFLRSTPTFSATPQKREQRDPGYRYTPPGKKSEAYGLGKYGPEHLRRISKTEPLAAEPQVTRVIPLGIDGRLPPEK